MPVMKYINPSRLATFVIGPNGQQVQVEPYHVAQRSPDAIYEVEGEHYAQFVGQLIPLSEAAADTAPAVPLPNTPQTPVAPPSPVIEGDGASSDTVSSTVSGASKDDEFAAGDTAEEAAAASAPAAAKTSSQRRNQRGR